MPMQRLQEWTRESDPLFGKTRVWAFDLDDTLTHEGVLPAKVLATLEKLQSMNHLTVMVTGRPTSWAQPFVKVLPFDAVIAENGASLCYWHQTKRGRKTGEEPKSLFWTATGYVGAKDFYLSQQGSDLQQKKEWLQSKVFAQFPQVTLASDQMFRLYDLAIDFAESVRPVRPLSEAKAIKALFESCGAVAKVSSIHVNGWWGDFDKSLGLQTLFAHVNWGMTFESTIYFGDSPNDAPLFEWAPLSVGVANLAEFAEDKTWTRPTYLASQNSADGVLEAIAHYISDSRKSS